MIDHPELQTADVEGRGFGGRAIVQAPSIERGATRKASVSESIASSEQIEEALPVRA